MGSHPKRTKGLTLVSPASSNALASEGWGKGSRKNKPAERKGSKASNTSRGGTEGVDFLGCDSVLSGAPRTSLLWHYDGSAFMTFTPCSLKFST